MTAAEHKPHQVPFNVAVARELTTFENEPTLEQALKWRLNEACDEIERLIEQYETLVREKQDWLTRGFLGPDDYKRLQEQLEAYERALLEIDNHPLYAGHPFQQIAHAALVSNPASRPSE